MGEGASGWQWALGGRGGHVEGPPEGGPSLGHLIGVHLGDGPGGVDIGQYLRPGLDSVYQVPYACPEGACSYLGGHHV